MTFLQTFRNTK